MRRILLPRKRESDSAPVRDRRPGEARPCCARRHQDQSQRSKHKAMSYERMEKRAAELEVEVGEWLEAAEATDAEEDKRYGADKTGEEMPDWIADNKQRAERIRQQPATPACTPIMPRV